jgi:hypothetical protein
MDMDSRGTSFIGFRVIAVSFIENEELNDTIGTNGLLALGYSTSLD